MPVCGTAATRLIPDGTRTVLTYSKLHACPAQTASSYCFRRACNNAFATLDGKNHYIGPDGSLESHKQHARLIVGCRPGQDAPSSRRGEAAVAEDEFVISELVLRDMEFAPGYYRKHGQPRGETNNIWAAVAGRDFSAGWEVYVRWISRVWRRRVAEVIEELERRREELGMSADDESEGGPRWVVAESLGYLENRRDQMRYDEYRQHGLLITSAHVE